MVNGGASANILVYINNGDATFQDTVSSYGAGYQPHSIFAADLDMDNDNDLVLLNHGYPNVPVFLNKGDGTFQEAVFYGAGDYAQSVYAADLDDDSDIDLAVANNHGDSISLLMNQLKTPAVYVSQSIFEPEYFSLSQNYPNPFNPKTTIKYILSQGSQVNMTIYNISGQVVSVLKDEFQQAGKYTITWDATGLPNGLYFYNLRGDDFTQTRKMVVVK